MSISSLIIAVLLAFIAWNIKTGFKNIEKILEEIKQGMSKNNFN